MRFMLMTLLVLKCVRSRLFIAKQSPNIPSILVTFSVLKWLMSRFCSLEQ